MGRVARAGASGVQIEPAAAHAIAPLKPGDGVVFDAADWRSPEEPEEGGRVFEVEARGGRLELRFGNGAVNAARIRPGDLVWRTHDPEVEKAARPFTAASGAGAQAAGGCAGDGAGGLAARDGVACGRSGGDDAVRTRSLGSGAECGPGCGARCGNSSAGWAIRRTS